MSHVFEKPRPFHRRRAYGRIGWTVLILRLGPWELELTRWTAEKFPKEGGS